VTSILAVAERTFAVGDQVKVFGDRLGDEPWTITEIVTDDPHHDGPFARLTNSEGDSWAALRILGRPEPCPTWCAGHLFGDVHISTDRAIETSSGPERGEVYVSAEQEPGQPAAVRLQGAADRPMTPAQALELAQALTVAAFAVVTR
jgi:hypothetical protein